MTEKQMYFVVHNINIHYKKPAILDDNLTISVSIESQSRAHITFLQTVYNTNDPSKIYCTASIKLIIINQDRRPIRIPSFITEALT
jgi:YbgC/YbaW family acyl-CoA thioester hydrolase